jgi:hypothetical protein
LEFFFEENIYTPVLTWRKTVAGFEPHLCKELTDVMVAIVPFFSWSTTGNKPKKASNNNHESYLVESLLMPLHK